MFNNTLFLLIIIAFAQLYTLSYVFFGIWSSIGFFIDPTTKVIVDDVEVTLIKSFLALIGLTLSVIYLSLTHRRSINLKKEINPLLKGSVYDFNFNKKILESSDEALKLTIYKSAYKSHNTVNATCLTLLIVLITLNYKFQFGIFPILIVGFILIVQNLSYYITYINTSK